MAAFDGRPLSGLFRERAQAADRLKQAQGRAERLVLEHNEAIREADHAATSHGRERARATAARKGAEGARARAEVEQFSRDLHETETKIADLIMAMWAATQSLMSANTVRQVGEHLDTISRQLQSVEERVAPISPALSALAAVLREQAQSAHAPPSGVRAEFGAIRSALDRQDGDIDAVMSATGKAADALAQIRQEVGHQSRILHTLGGRLNGEAGPSIRRHGPIVKMGWRPGAPMNGPRSPRLTEETLDRLPEKVTVLLFASEPRDQPRPDLDMEIREITASIDEAKFGDRIALRPWLATQAYDVIPNFNRHKPQMVQFSGHGTADGVLMMGPRDRSEPNATQPKLILVLGVSLRGVLAGGRHDRGLWQTMAR